MKKCPDCEALNSEKALFCWKCYRRLYAVESDGYISIQRRIREKMRDIIHYKDIRDLLREKIKMMAEREERGESPLSDEWI